MTKIIGISGRKQAGKNTVANIINGDVIKELNMVEEFSINNSGQLNIKTINKDGESGWGIFDVLRKDHEFLDYAEKSLFPYVKVYHFADYLKKISVELFDLTPQQVYGTDDDKNTDTPYGMTAREFLQYFGTDVMRKIKDTIWVDRTIKTIEEEGSTVAIIPDVRFPNEVDAIHKAGGVCLRLTRDPFESDHACECALDHDKYDWDNFDGIVHNGEYKLPDLVQQLETFNWMWR
jgi:hypothetical protein